MNNLFPIFPIYTNNISLFPYNFSPWAYAPQFTFSLQTNNSNSNFLNVVAPPITVQKLNQAPEQAQQNDCQRICSIQSISKIEGERSTAILDSNEAKQLKKKEITKKPQRPDKYLTEKAYYMNQKLKGKLRSEGRILRKRIKNKEKKNRRVSQHEIKENQTLKKRIFIFKDEEREKKVLHQIKIKLLSDYCQDFASIPKIIDDRNQLNQFCLKKKQNLILALGMLQKLLSYHTIDKKTRCLECSNQVSSQIRGVGFYKGV